MVKGEETSTRQTMNFRVDMPAKQIQCFPVAQSMKEVYLEAQDFARFPRLWYAVAERQPL